MNNVALSTNAVCYRPNGSLYYSIIRSFVCKGMEVKFGHRIRPPPFPPAIGPFTWPFNPGPESLDSASPDSQRGFEDSDRYWKVGTFCDEFVILLLSTNRFVSIRKRQAFPSFSSSSSSCQKRYRQVSAHIRMYTDFRSIVDERDSILLECFIGDYSSRNGGILINISWGGDWE